MSQYLSTKLSTQTSSVVSPDDLLRRIVAIKKIELINHEQTVSWVIDGVNEFNLADLIDAYKSKGLNASAEDDFFPGILPSGSGRNCSII